jgi:hypothetical protein
MPVVQHIDPTPRERVHPGFTGRWDAPAVSEDSGSAGLPPPIVRSGIDDPIGMPVEINAVRYGVYSWRYPMLFLLAIIVLVMWLGPAYPVVFIALAALPLLWVPATIRGRLMSRSVLRHAAAHGDRTADPRTAPILARGDWIRLGVVLAEIAFLIWLLHGGTA